MTSESNQQAHCPRNYPPYEDEINLIDYLWVLWKWKWPIVAGTLICVIIAAVISLQMVRFYEVFTIIEPGIEGVKDIGDFVYIDSPENMSKKIGEGGYNRRIQEGLGLDPLQTGIGFNPTIVKGTGTVKVTSQWKEGETDLGLKVTRQLIQLISDNHEKIIERKKIDYDKCVTLKMKNIEDIQQEIRVQQAILKDAQQRRGSLLKEINTVKNNTEKLTQQRDALLKENDQHENASLTLYFTKVQESMTYLTQLRDQAYDLDLKEKSIKNGDYKLNRQIENIRAEIEALNVRKGLISNMAIIEEPSVSPYPVKSRTKQIVVLAGVVSLLLFVFLAFCIEYIRRALKASREK